MLGAFRCAHAGLFELVRIVSGVADRIADKAAAATYEDRHIFFAYVLLALIAIHIAAAVWHHFVKRDRVASRMVDVAPG